MNIPQKASKYSAPGQYLGYALQPLRLCFHLINCPPGALVSMEHIEDVAVHYADGSQLLEQDKSALKSNPIADWADDLWKTIAHWLTAIANGDVDPNAATFRIYVTPAHAGEFASLLTAADTEAEVTSLVAEIAKKLSKKKKAPSCQADLQVFLDANEGHRFSLVRNLRIESNQNDPLDALRSALSLAVPDKLMDSVCAYLMGRAKDRADKLIRKNEAAIISGDEFKKNLHAFMQANNLPGYLASHSTPPEIAEVGAVISTRPNFIRQLELIEVDDEHLVRAASDFLRTSADKALWAEAGEIFEGALDEWDSDLLRRHGFICTELADTHPHSSPAAKGRLTYSRCGQLQPSLSGREVPGHFIHGSFNALANDLRLGWHPEYVELLGASEN